MKKIIISGILINSFLFGYTIQNKKVFQIKYQPDIYKTNLNINIKNKNLNIVIKAINLDIQKAKHFCKNINYSISPNFKYINNQRVFTGYNGNINMDCSFNKNNVKNFSNMFGNLIGIKNMSRIYSDISKEKKEKIEKELKKKAYKYILKDINKFSNVLNMSCYPVKININTNNTFHKPIPKPVHIFTNSRLIRNSPTIPIPINKNFKKEITASYTIQCF
jgi:hypothetical protein